MAPGHWPFARHIHKEEKTNTKIYADIHLYPEWKIRLLSMGNSVAGHVVHVTVRPLGLMETIRRDTGNRLSGLRVASVKASYTHDSG